MAASVSGFYPSTFPAWVLPSTLVLSISVISFRFSGPLYFLTKLFDYFNWQIAVAAQVPKVYKADALWCEVMSKRERSWLEKHTNRTDLKELIGKYCLEYLLSRNENRIGTFSHNLPLNEVLKEPNFTKPLHTLQTNKFH